jgi:hypothetical protein
MKFPLLSSQAFEDAWQHSGVVRCLSAAVMKDGVASWQRRILLPVTIFHSLRSGSGVMRDLPCCHYGSRNRA